ncbi:MAG: hypothetical protein EPN88_09685 [Bacteroidetes bacterium]|nr:MAG: hypothetical protein EPN88_09685 [Bacteroidota bacterium]
MVVRKSISVIVFFFMVSITNIFPQTYNQPNCALKSHPTLEILRVELTPEKTVLYLTIENRIEGGTFCADKNIYIIYPDGTRIKLINAAGIPVCPDAFQFKSIGEKLEFTLTFPPLKNGTKWIDLIEDCTNNCFSFYGITLDNDLNKKLDEAFLLASKGKPADNMAIFKNILDDIDNQNLGIEGLLYINIINAAAEDADKVNAMVWYKRLVSSQAPRLNQYIKYLNDKGIKY